MAVNSVRGSEVTVRFSIEGQPQGGTFERIEDFTVSEKSDITELDFMGKARTEFDYQLHGYEFSFTGHMTDATGLNFMELLSEREKARQAYPSVTMIVIHTFREPGLQPVIHTYKGVVMQTESVEFGSRKDYVKQKFKGMASYRLASNG